MFLILLTSAPQTWLVNNTPVARPAALDVDYGVPYGLCADGGAGVYERAYTRARAVVNCVNYSASYVELLGER